MTAVASRTDYRRLSVAEKQARHRDTMREPDVVCPRCETRTTVADSLRHAEVCPGPREPHPLSKWLRWKEVRRLGVARSSIVRWVATGRVRVRAEAGYRLFLERDVKKQLLARVGSRNGTSEGGR